MKPECAAAAAMARAPESVSERLGDGEGLGGRSEAVEAFAQSLTHDIIEALRSREVASAGGRAAKGNAGSSSFAFEVDSAPRAPPALPQSGLPAVGSLDYPDAPPTTPLLPELERSRQSFARKLKGGLAKEFLPSPPPPTPKDEHAPGQRPADLAERLLRSLSAGAGQEAPVWTDVDGFADALSAHILDGVLGARGGEGTAEDGDLRVLAQQMADTIISSSLHAAKTLT